MTTPATASHSHMQDYEAHVRAVEEDLEYWRTKRFEPRVYFLARRGIVTLYDILAAHARIKPDLPTIAAAEDDHDALEKRIRALEDGLDEYVRTIGLASRSETRDRLMVIEDTRKERGDYDPFFKIHKEEHGGTLEERVQRLEQDLRDYMLLLRAFLEAAFERGVLSRPAFEQRRAELLQNKGWNGARIVARAWVDPEFKRNLVEKGRETVRELDIPPGRLGKLGVAENTETVHHVVVCTLCSCYPHDLLGETPWWYKHDSYKQNIVRDPRGTLQEMFGLKVPSDREIKVHDSTSDVRWMVIPRRPAGTEGMSEEELAGLVTQESLIGAAEPLQPSQLVGAAETNSD